MHFLNSEHISSNIRAAVTYFLGYEPSISELKTAYIHALNKAQSSTIQTLKDDIYLEFNNQRLVDLLVRRDVFSSEDVTHNKHILTLEQQNIVRSKFRAAREILKNLNPNLHDLITMCVGSVACYHITCRDGGTVSCCIGLIWLSPGRYWQPEFYAELLVHEFVHNSVFLDDMVNGIMPNIHLLNREDALVTSVIRKTRRGYDKSYHSVCVGAALIYFHHLLGNEAEVESFIPPVQRTLRELEERDFEFRSKGEDILTDNGRKILREIKQFVETRDYDSVSSALKPTH